MALVRDILGFALPTVRLRQFPPASTSSGSTRLCARPRMCVAMAVVGKAAGGGGGGGRRRKQRADMGGKLEWLEEPREDPDDEIVLRNFRQRSRETGQQILFDMDYLLKNQNRYQLVLEIAEDATEWMKSPEGKKQSLHTNAVYRQIIEKRKSLDPEYKGVEATDLDSLQQIAKEMALAARAPAMVSREDLEEMLKKAIVNMDVELEAKVRNKINEMEEEELDEIEWD